MSVTTKTDTPDSGVMPMNGVMAVNNENALDIPADLIPKGAKTVIVSSVNTDGTLGVYRKSFKRYLTGFNVTGTRETEDLETGEGADETRPVSESMEVEVITNAYNPLFHALITGKDVVSDLMPVRRMASVTFKADGTFVFATEDAPVKETEALGYGIALYDANGTEIQYVKDSAATPTAEQFTYDETTKTLKTDATAFGGKTIDIIYFIQGKGLALETSSIIKSAVFKIECLSVMESANFGKLYLKRQVISRANLAGDAPEPPVQKDINTNMSYSISSLAPAAGEKVYVETFSEYEEKSLTSA